MSDVNPPVTATRRPTLPPPAIALMRLGAGLGAIALALSAQALIVARELPPEALLRYGLAALLAVIAFVGQPLAVFAADRLWVLPQAEPAGTLPAWLRTVRIAAVALAVSLGVLSVVQFAANQNGPGWMLHLVSVLVFIAALIDYRRVLNFGRGDRRGLVIDLLVLLGVLLLAGYARGWDLAEYPFGLWYDEANNGVFARQILQDPTFRPLYSEPLQLPAHFSYLTALSFSLFGVGVVQMRLVGVAFGLLSVALSYLIFKRWFGRPVGAAAAVLLAVMRYHLPWSRFGMFWGTPPAFELLILYFMDRALADKRPVDFALTGLAVGFSLAFYFATRLYVGVLLVFLLFLAAGWLIRRTQRARRAAETTPAPRRAAFWTGVVALVLGGLLAIAPVGYYALTHYEQFFVRTATVSIFEKRDEPDLGKALTSQVSRHLLMFNVTGDRNGRHNLPGEPMLDPVTGALAVLGFFIALTNLRRPANALMVLTFFVMLLGGILSLDFEAPQSLRSIGVIPAVVYFAALPLAGVWQAAGALPWGRALTTRWRLPGPAQLAAGALLLPLLVQAGDYNLSLFFEKQRYDNSAWLEHSTPETIVASEMNRLSRDYKLVVSASYLGHPTLRFLTTAITDTQSWTGAEPLQFPTDGRGLAVLVEPGLSAALNGLRAAYPNAAFREFTPPLGQQPVVAEALIAPLDISDAQGATAVVRDRASGTLRESRQLSGLALDWGATPPGAEAEVELRAVLLVPKYGSYAFSVEPGATLYLNENAYDGKPVTLPRGRNAVRVTAPGSLRTVQVRWQAPGEGAPTAIPVAALLRPPAVNNGLLGTFRSGRDGSGPIAFQQVDAEISFYFHNLPLPRPYGVTWTGKLLAPTAGSYRFGLQSVDEAALSIDGQRALDNDGKNQLREQAVTLEAGWHDIEIVFSDHSNATQIYLYWQPPNGPREIIPARYLLPPMGRYPAPEAVGAAVLAPVARVAGQAPPPTPQPKPTAVPATPRPGVSAPAAATPKPGANPVVPLPPAGPAPTEAPRLPAIALRPALSVGAAGAGEGQFAAPRGIAVDAQGRVFVADTANARVQVFDAQGKFIKALTAGAEPLHEPINVRIAKNGDVLVLDTGTAIVSRFTSALTFKDALALVPLKAQKPRTFWLESDDVLLVTDASARKVLRVTFAGELLGEIDAPGSGAPFGELSHAATLPDGTLFIADATTERVHIRAADGKSWRSVAIPKMDAATGPQFAAADANSLYVTMPGQHKVVQISRDGAITAELGREGAQPGEFILPTGLFAQDGALWVVETNGNRWQKLTR
ncbi:MAG: glycosyltransferase family 39 protein [Thermoflexales bacterium]|nr:glycosyltransferase family 39 protein [Thermoflexales bacterium]